jgi:glycerol-3-phosphate dehydrogenase subunit C
MVCSSGVPIAELNLLAKKKHLDEKGTSLRDWLLTHVFLFGPVSSLFSPVVNLALRTRAVRWFMDAFLKIDRRRDLPAYQFPTFRQWFRGHQFVPAAKRMGKAARGRVAYFYGCFVNTNEVDVGKAVVQVLEAGGREVVLPHQDCCGIPMLGSGDFEGARRQGEKNVPSLLDAVRSGMPLLYSSTSCGHMIKHEYGRLLEIPGAEELSPHLFDFCEFLRELNAAGTLELKLREMPLRAAYFAPCHLKTLDIGFPALEILRLVPGLQVENVEAHCCGLGGTYGFKKEKYEISEEIGKDLAEAIGRMKPDLVLTDCEGCRMQIRHLTGLRTLHPAQLLRDALL